MLETTILISNKQQDHENRKTTILVTKITGKEEDNKIIKEVLVNITTLAKTWIESKSIEGIAVEEETIIDLSTIYVKE